VADTRLLVKMSGRLYSRTPLIGDIKRGRKFGWGGPESGAGPE
jgi:hypothetical protein